MEQNKDSQGDGSSKSTQILMLLHSLILLNVQDFAQRCSYQTTRKVCHQVSDVLLTPLPGFTQVVPSPVLRF